MGQQRFLLYFFLSTLLSASNFAQSQQIRPLEETIIHEAYIQPVTSDILMQSVENAPPQPIQERIPEQSDPDAIWIPGYWYWSQERNDFVWVSGVWRLPPPDHAWINGFWTQSEEGWVWVKGFWSAIPESQFKYIDQDPPEQVDEEIENPPSEDYFWRAGYWNFEGQQYVLVPGNWEPIDPNWVLVPAHYAWRPSGYVLIPAYWDWPLDKRGRTYAAVSIEPEMRPTAVYEPTIVVQPIVIAQQLALYYPNYLYIVHHHYHYHPNFWINFSPPWWGWAKWWGFPSYHHWGLWWWYTHPGYPQPTWLTPALSERIHPPPHGLMGLTKRMHPPPFVTPTGVVPPHALVNAAEKGRLGEKRIPVIPGNRKKFENIQRNVEPKRMDAGKVLSPTGKGLVEKMPLSQQPVKPLITGSHVTPNASTTQKLLPKKPAVQPRTQQQLQKQKMQTSIPVQQQIQQRQRNLQQRRIQQQQFRAPQRINRPERPQPPQPISPHFQQLNRRIYKNNPD